MTEAVAERDRDHAELLEKVVIGGDLSKLSSKERLEMYRAICSSVGLNPLTRPLEYLTLNGKLTLYARRDATDQLRKLHRVSVTITAREQHGDVYAVVARAVDAQGRTDEAIGAVATAGLKGEALANALMKAETKSKRRVTLSICGLGMLDETELETIPDEARKAPRPEKAGAAPAGPVLPAPSASTAPPAAPAAEWLDAIGQASETALPPLWKSVTTPDVWRTFSTDEQTQLIDAKDARKRTLGVA
jgi:hypothetical protein